jgi:M6 family metalloprotease-like protein
MKKRLILALALLFAGLQIMNAIPAHPGKFVYTQPDGKRIVLQRHGDEFGHWLTDASGKVVRLEADGFYREVSEDMVSEVRRNAAARRSAAQQTRAAKAAGAVKGNRHFLVILVEFSDLAYSTCEDPNAAFSALLNEPGYSENGGTGSAHDYFLENSNGRFEPVFDVFGPVKLPNKKSYYGSNDYSGNDKRPEEALIDGCRLLDEDIDFSRYDSDGDGEVDMVLMYYAGYGEADSYDQNAIWPHEWALSGQGESLSLDGVKIDTYSCTNEKNGPGTGNVDKMCGIGTACHEFGHALGLPDMYDTDGDSSSGEAGGLYSYSVMCSGSYNNMGRTPPYYCFEERKFLGWMSDSDCLEFEKTGTYSIQPVNSQMIYRTYTDMDGEYFLYENRAKTGWDKYIPEAGLIVYHVDKSSRRVGWSTAKGLWDNWETTNAINCNGKHPCYYIVPSNAQDNLNYSNDGFNVNSGVAFPYRNINTYVPLSWNGVEGVIHLSDISYKNGTVTLRAYVPSGDVDYVTIADAGSYRVGDRFTFELVRPDSAVTPKSVVWYYDDEPAGADSVTLTKGDHTVEAQLTYADGRQSVLTLEIKVK